MSALPLTTSERELLATAATTYVQTAFTSGNFQNLKGIEPVLDFLGIDGIGFTEDAMRKIAAFYEKYRPSFLYSMTPTLYNGRLLNGDDFNKVEYTRGLLQRAGANEAELTDEYINDLWNFREVLVSLHRVLRGKPLPPPNKLLGVIRAVEAH